MGLQHLLAQLSVGARVRPALVHPGGQYQSDPRRRDPPTTARRGRVRPGRPPTRPTVRQRRTVAVRAAVTRPTRRPGRVLQADPLPQPVGGPDEGTGRLRVRVRQALKLGAVGPLASGRVWVGPRYLTDRACERAG